MASRLRVLGAWLTSRFAQSVGIYTASNILSAAIPFLLLPVLTRYLSPQDYGTVAMFQVVIGVIAVFTGLSVNNAIARQYYERDKIDFPGYVSNCLYLLVGSTLVASLVVWLCAPAIERWTGVAPSWLWLVVAVAASQFVIKTVLTLWQVKVQPMAYAAFQVLLTLTNFGMTLWFVVGTSAGWEGRVEAQLIAYSVFACVALIVLLRGGYLGWGVDRALMRHALRYGLPLIPNTLGGLVITMTDRTLITNMIDLDATGVYVVGMQFGLVIGVLQDSFHKGWLPWFFGQLKRGNDEQDRRIVKLIYAYDVGILALALVVGFGAPWLYSLLIAGDYAAGQQCVLWIALGYAFNGMYKMRSGYLFYENKTHLLAAVTAFAAVVNVVASYLLIGVLGYVGAALGTMIAFFVGFVLTWALASRVHDVPWRLGSPA